MADANETKDWKIYRSEKYKFELSYPSNLTASTPYGPGQISLKKDSIFPR
jgi:hypothetical protein